MTALELNSFAVDLALQTKAAIAAAVGPYDARVKALEAEIATLRDRALVPGPVGPVGPRGADGSGGRDGQSVDPLMVKSLIVEEVARATGALERPRDGRDGKDVDLETIKMLVDAAVSSRPLPKDGRDGKDVDLETIRTLIDTSVEARPLPRDGRDGKDVDIQSVKLLVEAAVAAIPVPKDGRDGKDIDPHEVKMLVEAAVAARPTPKDGINGKDADLGEVKALIETAVSSAHVDTREVSALVTKAVADAMASVPAPKDGRDADTSELVSVVTSAKATLAEYATVIAEVRQRVKSAVVEEVSDAVSKIALPKDGAPGRDGAGVTGGLIDRDGHLILTLSDGGTKDVGLVVGQSAEVSDVQRFVEAQLATWERPKDGEKGLDGTDGLGFDDLDVIFNEATGYALRFTRGAEVKDFRIAVPWYAGVWQAGRRYPKGAMLTHKGGEWTAKADTFDKPGQSTSWQLSTKGGRDGRDAPGGRGDE